MKDEWQSDQLWDLLGRAKPVEVSPFFSRNVIRELRMAPERPFLPVFLMRWLALGTFAVLAAGFFLNLGDSLQSDSFWSGKPSDFAAMFDEAAGLNSLLAVQDVSITSYTSEL